MPTATFQMLVVALVHSRLDYGIPAYLVRRLQSVLKSAARLLNHLRPHDHISDALATRHWLRVPELVLYQIAMLTCFTSARRDIWDVLSPSLTYPPSRAAHQTVYCWQPCLSGCRSSSLERSARDRRLIVISAICRLSAVN